MGLQVVILNKICLWGMIAPMVYIVFIFSLPFDMPKWLVVLLGFCCGFVVDIFFGVLGFHALATLVMAFLRAGIIQLIPLRIEREEHLLPFSTTCGLFGISNMLFGLRSFTILFITSPMRLVFRILANCCLLFRQIRFVRCCVFF